METHTMDANLCCSSMGLSPAMAIYLLCVYQGLQTMVFQLLLILRRRQVGLQLSRTPIRLREGIDYVCTRIFKRWSASSC